MLLSDSWHVYCVIPGACNQPITITLWQLLSKKSIKVNFSKKSFLRHAEVNQVCQECSIFDNKIEKIIYIFRHTKHISWNASQVWLSE